MGKKKRKYLRVSDPNFVCQDRVTFSGVVDLYITRNIRKRYSGVIINEGGANFTVLIETSYGYHAAARTLQPGGNIELRDFPLSRIVFQSDASAMFTVLVWASERPEAFVRTTVPTAGGGMTSHALLSTWHLDTLPASPVLGDFIIGNASPLWQRLAGNILTTKKFLSQTGTGAISALPVWDNVDWANLTGKPATFPPSAHDILSASHGDTLTASVVAGDILIGNATPKWARLAKATDGWILTLVSGLPAWAAPATSGNFQLVSEQILEANAQDVDFTGLDINTHKAYKLIVKFKGLYAGALNTRLYINGDYTDANYYSQYLMATGASVGGGRNNFPEFAQVPEQNANVGAETLIQRDVDGYFRFATMLTRRNGANVDIQHISGVKTASVTNITSLRIHAVEGTNAISSGSRFALYKITGA